MKEHATEALEWFNELVTGELKLELSEPAVPLAPGRLDRVAPSEAQVVSLRLEAEAYDDEEPRPLTEAELATVVLEVPSLELASEDGPFVTCHAPDGRGFTVRDLLSAVERVERATRGDMQWLGGVDVHHVFFEGIWALQDGRFRIEWGS